MLGQQPLLERFGIEQPWLATPFTFFQGTAHRRILCASFLFASDDVADSPARSEHCPTAFGNEEAHLAHIGGHLSPQIRALDTQHKIEPLREGQRFNVPVDE